MSGLENPARYRSLFRILPHQDTRVRLLAVYRAVCRRDPACPYSHAKLVSSALSVFNIKVDNRCRYLAGNRNRLSMGPELMKINRLSDPMNMRRHRFSRSSGQMCFGLSWHIYTTAKLSSHYTLHRGMYGT
jgi:hypothetical protein